MIAHKHSTRQGSFDVRSRGILLKLIYLLITISDFHPIYYMTCCIHIYMYLFV